MDHQLSLSLPRLDRLTLDGLVPKSDRMRVPIVLGDAPLLRYADIRNIKIDRPLERLTTLRLRATDVRTRIDEAQTIAALQCCPNLLELDLSCLRMAGGKNVPTILALHSLRSLKVTNPNMLPFLTVPRLERLQISRMDDIEAASHALQSLLLRSSCHLQFLSMEVPMGATAAQTQHFLRAANSISHLKLVISNSFLIEPVIQALHSVDVLPQLEHLEISNATNGAHPLPDVLWWRWKLTGRESFELLLGMLELSQRGIMAEVMI
jgi:hypothetical protein